MKTTYKKLVNLKIWKLVNLKISQFENLTIWNNLTIKKMVFENYKYIYFLGIGGIGMSGIARFFKQQGLFVAGYDLTETSLTQSLVSEGIFVCYKDDINLIPKEIIENKQETLIVLTPAIPKNHFGYNFLIQNEYKILKRAQVLGLLSQNKKTIGIAGTHGKTTITSLTTHILKTANKLEAAFVGGIMKNYNNNYVFGEIKTDNWLVLESDEFDRSFLNFHPNISVVSAIDADHLDIYETKSQVDIAFNQFISQTSDLVIVNQDVNIFETTQKVVRYGEKSSNNFYYKNLRIINDKQYFDIVSEKGEIKDICISLPGKVNVENSLVAFAVAQSIGIDDNTIKKALASFTGIERRFDLILKNEKHVYINDYAHHPVEIDRLREAVREFYPNRKITAVFQPHLFSRTRDFADGFAQSLSQFDDILLMDIYPARELPMEGVSSKIIFDKIENQNKILVKFEDVIKTLKNKQLDIVLTVGAGSIDNLVGEIKILLNWKIECKKYN